ncbi:MAG: FHA domain-containing protein [Proteobacteria bacterium]|nr:FHA domain-containing protein [Pseudomonadota bacterium]
MRVVCIQPARDPILCGQGPVQFGSAPVNDVVQVGAGVEPRHATVVADARGLVLTVNPGSQRVYVNARAVRERALLHYGDTLALGANKYLLTTDEAPPQPGEAATLDGAGGLIVLRVVSGVLSGQALAIAPELRLGAGARYFGELACACRIAQGPDGLVFESDSATPRVNGWRCQRARLAHGDQIVLGEHRLIVEAPGLQYAAHVAALPPTPVARPAPEPEPPAQGEVWWLIAAAVLLAMLIAFFLYFRW